ncbi:MAG: aminomethyl-transferring glycine dehydrogenase subunit GcvPA [Alphaproteobacteria bacterium]|nr:aminomethyl-transferring glycine dehydrogenase subunit GcvPA [Alphaproteobacteria bacterium]
MRYLPLSDANRRDMLAAVGVKSIDDLFADIPAAARAAARFELPNTQGELEVERHMSKLAAKNLPMSDAPSFLGCGNYRHHSPASLDYLIQRGEFLTAYTPYQPEIAQGTLQAIYEFQTQVTLITGMEVANASMYDGATACAEAAAMACRVTKRAKVLLSGGLHPHYRDVTSTSLRFLDIQCDALAPDPLGIEDLIGRVGQDLACVIVQTPGFFGHLNDFTALAAACHAAGALLIVAVPEPVSLGLVKPPGEMGADIVIGDGQSLATPSSFGGPGVGLFATREKFLRQMPGRLAGETTDEDGRRGWVLTLSTREQHIRREKATSNICTNSGLIALAFSIHLTLLGEKGFRHLAELNHATAVSLAEKLEGIKGVKVLPGAFFNEFAVTLPKPAAAAVDELARRCILGGVPASRFYPSYPELANVLIVAATEMNTESDIAAFAGALKEIVS